MHVSKGYFLFNLTKNFFGYPNSNSQAQTNKTAKDVILIVVIHNLTKELRRTGDLMDKNLVF